MNQTFSLRVATCVTRRSERPERPEPLKRSPLPGGPTVPAVVHPNRLHAGRHAGPIPGAGPGPGPMGGSVPAGAMGPPLGPVVGAPRQLLMARRLERSTMMEADLCGPMGGPHPHGQGRWKAQSQPQTGNGVANSFSNGNGLRQEDDFCLPNVPGGECVAGVGWGRAGPGWAGRPEGRQSRLAIARARCGWPIPRTAGAPSCRVVVGKGSKAGIDNCCRFSRGLPPCLRL